MRGYKGISKLNQSQIIDLKNQIDSNGTINQKTYCFDLSYSAISKNNYNVKYRECDKLLNFKNYTKGSVCEDGRIDPLIYENDRLQRNNSAN